jgi:hypothetical protein
MEISREMIDILSETLRRRRKDETFERTLGKVLRGRKLPYSTYIGLMSVIRGEMRKGLTADDAARSLCSDYVEKQ